VVEVREQAPSQEVPAPHASSGLGPRGSVALLGGFELRWDGQAVALPKTARRLLVFLALAHRPLTRPYVSQSLWLEAPERLADGNLRSALWKVGQLAAGAVDASGGQLALDRRVTVDYQESVALARRLVRDPGSLDNREFDEEPFTRELLPDWYEEWVLAERERYRQIRLHALEGLCLELAARRRFGQAVQAGLAAVAGEPLRESATLALIRAFLAEGNAYEAVRHYRSFTRLLWDELRVRPSSRMRQLMGGMRALTID
jgi:DNA-binding SARP family transcriptional activator